jgi:hypothetical protein
MPNRAARNGRRQSAEQWFPVAVRYAGLTLGAVMVVATVLGYADPLQYAGAYTFVTFMILYKTVNDYQGRGESSDRGDHNAEP